MELSKEKLRMSAKQRAAQVINRFLKGLLIVLPFAVTISLITSVVGWVDQLVDRAWVFLQTHSMAHPPVDDSTLHVGIPALGFLIVFVSITLLGYIGSSIITRPLFSLVDDFLSRIPFVKIIYTSVKDFMEAFVGDKRKFNEPVLVEMMPNMYKPGFITQKELAGLKMPGFVAVYCPHSYAFSGDLFIIAKEKVKPLDANATEVMKFIVSGGVTDIDHNNQ